MSRRIEAFETRPPEGDDRQLGHGEKAVQKNEQHDDDDLNRSHP
jgi:hypothetical protein